MATSPALHISRDRFHLAWDPTILPIETVRSGAEVEFDLLDASGGQLTATSTAADLAALDFNSVDQVNGPIAVDGARPGDVLQVDLLDFQPADWGWTATFPGFGLLADDFPNPAYHITKVPRVGERAEFLPVFHDGARFSVGDGHAAQGDGEVCGTAIETPMRALVRLTVRNDLALSAPEFITAAGPAAEAPVRRRYATDGIGPDLLSAARDAVRRMIDWLGREHGIAPIDAYMLCSVGVDLRISEIVDMPNFVVTAHCPLGIFD